MPCHAEECLFPQIRPTSMWLFCTKRPKFKNGLRWIFACIYMCMFDCICVQLGSLRVSVYICVYIHGCICITHCKPLGLCLCLHIHKKLNLECLRQPRCRWVYFCIHTSLHLYRVRHPVGCCLYLYTQCMLMCVSRMTSYVSLPVFVCTSMRPCVSTMASMGFCLHLCKYTWIYLYSWLNLYHIRQPMVHCQY